MNQHIFAQPDNIDHWEAVCTQTLMALDNATITKLDDWVTRYPIFTLAHLLYNVSALDKAQKNTIKRYIIQQLRHDPKLIEPLKQHLKTNEKNIISHPEFTIKRQPPIRLLNQLTASIVVKPVEEKSSLQIDDAIKDKIYAPLLAEPDGTFHWTKKYKKMLAEFEETDPLALPKYQYGASWSQQTYSFRDNETIGDYVSDVVSGQQTFNQKALEALLEKHYEKSCQSFVYNDILGSLSKTKTYTQLLEVMAMGMWHQFHTLGMSYDNFNYPLPDMFVLLQEQKQKDTPKIIACAQKLVEKYPTPAVRISIFFLFPEHIDFVTGDKKHIKQITHYFYRHFMRFFNHPEVFGLVYAYAFAPSYSKEYSWSEPLFLLNIKHRQSDVIQMVDAYLIACTEYSPSTGFLKKNLPKVRKNFQLLRAYHHADALKLLLSYSHETIILPELAKWVERYPIFTLVHLSKSLNKKNVSTLIKDSLYKNPLLIEPLMQALQDDKALKNTILSLTTDITQEQIQQALDAKVAILEQKNEQPKKPKKITSKRLIYPALPLTRITTETQITVCDTLDDTEKYYKNSFIELIKNPEKYLYPIFEEINQPAELAILKANYDNFCDDKKWLANIFMKPSVLTLDNFNQIERFKDNDFFMRPDKEKLYNTTESINYSSVVSMVLKRLSMSIRSAIFMGDFPVNKLRYRYRLGALYPDVLAFFHDRPDDEVANIMVTKYFPLYDNLRSSREKLSFISNIVHHISVPYLIDAFNTKKSKRYMDDYFQKNPETVINETIYLLFTKQTDPQLKKTQKNAKVLFAWLVENHKKPLMKTLKAYDTQLTNAGKAVALVDFLATYEAWTADKKAQDQQVIPQTTNTSGIPESLLSDDWQKATRKRNLMLSPTIHYHDFPVLVVAQSQQPLPKQAQIRLLTMMLASDFKKPLPMLLPTLQYMSKDSQTILADALWDEYLRLDMPNTDKWLMMASGYLYHEGLDDKVWQFIKRWESSTKRGSIKLSFAVLAQQALSHPNTKACDNALRMLIRISQKSRATLRPPAKEQIERYAKTAGLNQEDIADSLIPTLGLDAQGKRIFDFGSRQFTMTLDAHLNLKFADNNDKAYKNLPKVGQKDDVAKATLAHTELKHIKKQLKDFIRDDIPRMEDMLSSQRRLTVTSFQKFYVHNPLMLRYSFQLIWGVFDKDNPNTLRQPFRVFETGEILDIHHDNLTLSEDDLIGLVHPLQLSDEQKNQLVNSLQDDEIIQPFLQLTRPIYQLTDTEKQSQSITRFQHEKFATGSVMGFKNKGWHPYQIGGGFCEGFTKTVNGHNLFFGFSGFGLWEGAPAKNQDKGQKLQEIHIRDGMSDIDISEFIYILDGMERLD